MHVSLPHALLGCLEHIKVGFQLPLLPGSPQPIGFFLLSLVELKDPEMLPTADGLLHLR